MINSRDIGALNPDVQEMCYVFLTACRLAGIDVIITSTYRDTESQNALYAIGRTVKGANATAKKPMGDKVTNARGGQSFHQYRCAFDFVPLVHGKAVWNDTKLFEQCGALGQQCGLEWAGSWTQMKEMAHLQFTGGRSLPQLQEGKKP